MTRPPGSLRWSRRALLRAAAAGMALPLLESVHGVLAAAGGARRRREPEPDARRLVCVGTFLGLYGGTFFPARAGRDFDLPPMLEPLRGLRDRWTVFSGLDHRAPVGHKYWRNYLTGPEVGHVSFDQLMAARLDPPTRFLSLPVTCGSPTTDEKMCFTPEGTPLPMIGRPSVLFRKLFGQAGGDAVQRRQLDTAGSVLDLVREETRALGQGVSTADRVKLDEYLASVRDVEKSLQRQRQWLDQPREAVDYDLPAVDPVEPSLSLECESIMYDLLALALETDSARVLSFLVPGAGQVFTIDGKLMSSSYHGLSHHSNDPGKIAGYARIGLEHTRRLARFLHRLADRTDAEGRSLLDSTIVLYGSGMGDANNHSNSNLPILVAGGGFRHGAHVVFDRVPGRPDTERAPRLGGLFLTIAGRMGVELPSFANASVGLDEHFA